MIHENQLPTWSYINFILLYEIESALSAGNTRITLEELMKNADKRLGMSVPLSEYYSPINSGTIFSFLYSLIVVPKEYYSKHGNDFFFKDFSFNREDFFTIEFGDAVIPDNEQLFRILRNSISHVNYSCEDDDFTIHLWNSTSKGDINIKMTSNINKLAHFGIEVAKFHFRKNNISSTTNNDQ